METKKIATRDGFGEAIVELGRENRDILVVDIDIGKSCKTGAFRKELGPDVIIVNLLPDIEIVLIKGILHSGDHGAADGKG